MNVAPLGWLGIIRLGLVQTALGAIVVLATSVMNRVMVIELALPAIVPGALVALHYAVQLLRPRLGYGSDRGGRRTPWIIAGMAVLAAGGLGAAFATSLMQLHRLAGIVLAIFAFIAIGLGVGASGTSLLVLLAKRTAPQRRVVAATVVWLMMIAGFVVTTIVAGRWLDPFSPARLIAVTAVVVSIAFVGTLIALWRVEGAAPSALPARANTIGSSPAVSFTFKDALREVWSEAPARRLTIFVFVSMLAYSAEELILDPFSGAVFGYTPGQSTQLSGALHGGVFIGMLLIAVLASVRKVAQTVSPRLWMIVGCGASALALLNLASTGMAPLLWPLRYSVMALGVANGVFAVSAIGSMMQLAGSGAHSREGVRMGLWGAAQGLAFGMGGLLGSAASDLARSFMASQASAYALVFVGESSLFVIAALVAVGMDRPSILLPRIWPLRRAAALAPLHGD